MSRMTRLTVCATALLLAIAVIPAQARHRHNQGGVDDAEGAYAAVFPIEQARPNAQMTPGARNRAVTQDTIDETICVRGYTKTIRPPTSYTSPLKRRQIRQYGYDDHRMRDYEEDHLIALEIGGSPSSPRNLWPQPHNVIGGWGSYAKDRLENKMHTLVCRRKLPLAEAQSMMAKDWIAAYKRFIGPVPTARRHRNGE